MDNKGKKAIFISVAELAKLLGVSRVTVFNRIKKGLISAQKVGRSFAVSVEDADEILRGEEVLTEQKKAEIKKVVQKVVKEYGETLKLLGKE